KEARLLAPTARLRFVPTVGYSGTVTDGLSFRAWDRSSGTNGLTAGLSATGGSTPFSSGTGQVGVKVAEVNTAPVLSKTGTLALPMILENDFAPTGTTISNLLAGLVSDADGDVCGIVFSSINSQPGSWQYSRDGGRSWTELELPRGIYSRLLGPDVELRFVPDVDFFGSITNGILVRAWDQTRGTDGGLAIVVETGGQTPYSRNERWVSQLVVQANRAPTAINLDQSTVLENQPIGTLVGRLTASDPNPTDTHTFAFVAGDGDTGNAAFTISSNAILTAVVLDRELQPSYSVRIRARDKAGASFATALAINVADEPDTAPSDILLDPSRVAENEPAGTIVGELAAVDPDLGETHAFALVNGEGDDDNAGFEIQGAILRTTAPLDFETQQYCSIRVRVDDGHGGQFTRILIVAVGNVEDNTPPLGITLNLSCLLDGAEPGTTVGLLTARDIDLGDAHTFSFVPGEGDTDNDAFAIQGQALVTAVSADFSQHSVYRVRIQADDGRGGTRAETFEIVQAGGLWRDDCETESGAWTFVADAGTATWQILEGPNHSAVHALTAVGTTALSDASAVSPRITIPAEARQLRLEFHQEHEWSDLLPSPIDGGVLELQVDDGSWWDVLGGEPDNRFVAGDYPLAMPTTADHPLSERWLWSGSNSNEFESVVLALDAAGLAGRNVRMRWRQVVASGVESGHWRVDDVSLSMAPPPGWDFIRIEECVSEGSLLQLTWRSVPGQSYRLEVTEALGDPWVAVGVPVAGQPGSRTSAAWEFSTLPEHPNPALFFRVRSP
ncbi:MAG: cadherin repeat domain-containing protein, partial [Verrucomicrobiae bacterium]|nr:cadherin repeat domain-containing protein [Verrucomicrobiae bacterium]